MPTEADELRQEIRDLFERSARGDIRDKDFHRQLAEKSVALSRMVVRARLSPGETILAEHHLEHSHFKLNQSLLAEPEQATASFFASDRRLIRVRGTMRRGRPVSCDEADQTIVDDLPYRHMQQVLKRSQIRWGEVATGCAIVLMAWLLGRTLAVTGPLLVVLGLAGVLHGLLLPTRWIEIVARGVEPVPPFQIHGVRRKGARKIHSLVRQAIAAECSENSESPEPETGGLKVSATPYGGFGTDNPPHQHPRASHAPVAATATATATATSTATATATSTTTTLPSWVADTGRSLPSRVGHAVLFFLEVIGLRAPRPTTTRDQQMARFRRYYGAFRRLLTANDSFLLGVSDLNQRLVQKQEALGPAHVREATSRMLDDVRRMIESLNEISDGHHEALWPPFEAVKTALMAVVDSQRKEAGQELVLDIGTLAYRDVDGVGAKMANLGEIRNHVGLPAPDGFAVTVQAYQRFLETSGLAHGIDIDNSKPVARADEERASAQFVDAVRKAAVPSEIGQAILAAYDRLAVREGRPCPVAVRSSALGEDELFSFAGQYETVLNVAREGLVEAWRAVVASLYSRTAIHYRRLQGLPISQAAMPVGFVTMIPAIAAGIVFSRDPARADRGQVIVQVAPGLGSAVADGSTIPQTIEVTLGDTECTIRRPGAISIEPGHAGYPDEVTEDLELALASQQSLLTDAEAEELARWARKLEAHFGGPQDVEWAMDGQRRLFVLQSRPLELAQYTAQDRPPVPGATLLLSVGEVVCPGIGTGVAVLMDEDGDFETFPKGAVLVVKRPSPKFVRLMGKAVAIVADTGSTTGHMASLAREFRVPTLLGTREGTRAIPAGQLVTVDAFAGYVYAGDVDVPLVDASPGAREARGSHDILTRLLLRRAAERIVPLHLTDPRAPEFRAENCTTLHDITRYVHERSYEEMFRLGESVDDVRSVAYYLDVFLPVDLYIIDVGGGVEDCVRDNRIKPNQITSAPLAALLKGMLHPKIPRWGARPIDLGGFASVVMQHALTSPEQERTFRDPSYALVSDRYLNYTARVGYHFSIVDAYCGDTTNKNYVHLLFRGGAADSVRRSRRARAIAGILKAWGFSVEVRDDSTDGRIHKMPREETARLLEHVGRLVQFMRQMDVAMTSESAIEEVKAAFLREDYALEHLSAPGKG
jgi:pyruvate, water dikinase